MNNTLSPKLKKGSRVAVVSPASHAKDDHVLEGVKRLSLFGYEPVVMPHALANGPLYYAGTAEDRVADLHQAFADTSIDGVLCTRGGWGSAELLPLLNAELIRANPKVFVGFSDQTSLHVWLWKMCGLKTFYAPMVAGNWARAEGVDQRTWLSAVEGVDVWSVGAADGMRVLREGTAEGRLLGGCLSIVEAGLGTPWSLQLDEPTVLFVEDTGTKPYQWDRMLQHLRFAGLMERVRGVVLGDMSASVEEKDVPRIEESCLHALAAWDGPVSIGLKCGHVEHENRSVPLGAWVRMSADGLVAAAKSDAGAVSAG